MLFAGVNGALIYAVVDGLGRSPAYVGLLYVVQGAGSVTTGLAAGPSCAGSANAASPRPGSRSPRRPWRCARSRPTRPP